jgi:MoaA/NifB/PqqE/SkfB family radical SAM enzyme
MSKILRLLVTKDCHRSCPGCCNNDWDLDNLPRPIGLLSYLRYDEVLLTGGEPLLRLKTLYDIVKNIRSLNNYAKIYVYTNKLDVLTDLLYAWKITDGLTITLHNQEDADKFVDIYRQLPNWVLHKSNRLNIFEDIKLDIIECNNTWLCGFKLKQNIQWIKDCPLPKNETFMRL